MDDIVRQMDDIELNPQSRQKIVGAIDNARNEFEIVWKQGVDTGRRRSELTIELSEAMNDLFDVIF